MRKFESYNFKYHFVFSIILSFIIGIMSFLLLRPNNINTSKGVIESLDTPGIIHTQISYGYSSVFTLVIISLIILLILFKPIQKLLKTKE